MIGTELSFGRFRASYPAGTTLGENKLLALEGCNQLGREIHHDFLLFVWDFGRKNRQFLVWDQPHIVRSNIIISLQMRIIDLVPDAFFISLHNYSLHPVRAAIIDAITALCVGIGILFRVTERDRN